MAHSLTTDDLIAIDKLFGAQLLSVKQQLQAHDHTLYGNGQPGLASTVTILTEQMKAINEGKTNSRARNIAIVAALVGAVGIVATDILVHVIQSMPGK